MLSPALVLNFMLAFSLACAQPDPGVDATVVELRAEVEELKEKVKQLEAAPSVVPPGIYPLLREWGCGHHNLQVPKLLLPRDGGAGQWVVDIGLGSDASETLAAVRSGFVVFSFEPLLANIQSIRAIVAKSSNERKVTFLSATWIVAAARHGLRKGLGGAERGGWTWQAVDALGVKVEARSWASVSAALSDLVASRAGNKASGQAIIVHAALDATPGVAFLCPLATPLRSPRASETHQAAGTGYACLSSRLTTLCRGGTLERRLCTSSKSTPRAGS